MARLPRKSLMTYVRQQEVNENDRGRMSACDSHMFDDIWELEDVVSRVHHCMIRCALTPI